MVVVDLYKKGEDLMDSPVFMKIKEDLEVGSKESIDEIRIVYILINGIDSGSIVLRLSLTGTLISKGF